MLSPYRHADAERRTPSDHLHALWPRAVHHERQDDDRNDSLRAQGHPPPHGISNGAGTHRGHDSGRLHRTRQRYREIEGVPLPASALPLKLFVSTVVSTTGTSKIRVAFASATVQFVMAWRSKLAVPNIIWLVIDERHHAVVRSQKPFFTEQVGGPSYVGGHRGT
jgi:hypothetical protein